MPEVAEGTFELAMEPAAVELEGAVARSDFTKTWRGDLDATGAGTMLSCGDPRAGEAGYIAMETVSGQLGDRDGGFALQQIGTMHAGAQTQHYEVVPGSGRDALQGIVGTLRLTIEADGTHRYRLEYDL